MTALKLDMESDRVAIVTRRFAASPMQVYRAHVEPDLIRKWMYGFDGWTITDAVSEPHPGGTLRIVWQGPDGGGFHVTGHYIAVTPGERIEHVEQMHLPDPTPENHCITTFTPAEGGTLLTLRMELPDAESMKAMLDTGATDGMEVTYSRIDPIFAGPGS